MMDGGIAGMADAVVHVGERASLRARYRSQAGMAYLPREGTVVSLAPDVTQPHIVWVTVQDDIASASMTVECYRLWYEEGS